MKTSHLVPLFLALISGVAGSSAGADTTTGNAASLPLPTTYRVVAHDANSRVWQRETYASGSAGQVITNVHKYTELCSGMYYQDTNHNWQESQETIEACPAGAMASQGPCQVVFANNLNSEGAVDVQTTDGKRLRSNILGLAYYDVAAGQSVVIGEIQDSQGGLISSNQVLYPNAFVGVNADVRYTYKRGSLEQDVILREKPPTPESLGLNPATTEIQVLTEFIDPPAAMIVSHAKIFWTNALPDDDISWGATRMGQGKAFDLGGTKTASHVQVRRQYGTVQGRQILREGVPWSQAGSHLGSLPLHASINQASQPKLAASEPVLPPTPLPARKPRAMMMASAATPDQGFVLDYIEINSQQTNLVFQGDATYHISGFVSVLGTVTIEGGAVLKFDSDWSTEIVASNLVCRTGPYRPAILTSMSDDSVGETISGSSGTPGLGDAIYLDLFESGQCSPINNLRFAYAGMAFSDDTAAITNCQFLHCGQIVNLNSFAADASAVLDNVLISDLAGFFVYSPGTSTTYLNHVTLNNVLSQVTCGPLCLTNCILCNVSGNTFAARHASGSHNGFYNSTMVGDQAITNADYPFQTVGGGSFYLASASVFHGAGTTNVDPAARAELAPRTTYPPVVYANATLSEAATLGPQAVRDNSGSPDLGYHYDPLDYVFGDSSVATANVTFTAGTAVGFYYGSSDDLYALALGDSVTASFNGTATAPCRWARYSTVQEGNGNWTLSSWLGGIVGQSYSTAAPVVQMAFTGCHELAGEGNFFRDENALLVVSASDSEFYNGGVSGYSVSYNLTNCLFVNDQVGLWENHDAANLTLQNCTMIRGFLYAANTSGGAWPVTIVNSAFDETLFYMDASGGPTNGYYTDYNAFLLDTNFNAALASTNQTAYLGGHEVIVTNSYNWQHSWLGNYYLPPDSPLIDAGSTTADQLGLYHFTTQTNQVPETNSVVDMGYHYVATDASGNPLDSNGDGIPDYLEDANGNGLVDNGETSWLVPPPMIISSP